MPTEPKHTHDCDRCVYLGYYTHPDYLDCDLYYCPRANNSLVADTVIARYGSGGQYTSGNVFSHMTDRPDHPLVEARKRAEKLGVKVPGF